MRNPDDPRDILGERKPEEPPRVILCGNSSSASSGSRCSSEMRWALRAAKQAGLWSKVAIFIQPFSRHLPLQLHHMISLVSAGRAAHQLVSVKCRIVTQVYYLFSFNFGGEEGDYRIVTSLKLGQMDDMRAGKSCSSLHAPPSPSPPPLKLLMLASSDSAEAEPWKVCGQQGM